MEKIYVVIIAGLIILAATVMLLVVVFMNGEGENSTERGITVVETIEDDEETTIRILYKSGEDLEMFQGDAIKTNADQSQFQNNIFPDHPLEDNSYLFEENETYFIDFIFTTEENFYIEIGNDIWTNS